MTAKINQGAKSRPKRRSPGAAAMEDDYSDIDVIL
jgi:hypothetical protein